MEKIAWRFEIKSLADIKPWDRNPRRITKKGMEDLTKSIQRFGLPEPIVLNLDNTIIGGHARYQVLKKEGATEAVCAVPDRMLDEKELEELNIRLNKNVAGEFDFDRLANEFDQDELEAWGFKENELIGDLGSSEGAEVQFTMELLESQNYVVLITDNDIDWANLTSVMGLKTVQSLDSKPGYTKTGIGRVLRWSEVAKKLGVV